jgi:hypothetical protein
MLKLYSNLRVTIYLTWIYHLNVQGLRHRKHLGTLAQESLWLDQYAWGPGWDIIVCMDLPDLLPVSSKLINQTSEGVSQHLGLEWSIHSWSVFTCCKCHQKHFKLHFRAILHQGIKGVYPYFCRVKRGILQRKFWISWGCDRFIVTHFKYRRYGNSKIKQIFNEVFTWIISYWWNVNVLI